ncbi:MlaD family protein [Mycolicibacterium brumae]|uniref:Mammalian cell entry protein n=1 Tax=Mycolicibacterium brumae TaxID=85968 RepID=A0A2G5PE39_9MYCO|nr:MCE family protein [Mycolicibacterium brumae]MCV7191826.1 MCE family protein [Mycolicibacterium brumae]PIB76293.1 mammalian cell entry protein [Mycolicibacterium brumae]RWA15795.1 hypothetical protein MBRU_09605 [Mycolicibacterium brumae DSM 44177]UWW07132.1 MCE family protein [Mycolicibacterium brumae]
MGQRRSDYEQDGRGLTGHQIFLCGVVFLTVMGLTLMLLSLRSAGKFENYTKPVLKLVNVGDGLPPKSDVKYHGMIVGWVEDVVPALGGERYNQVHVNIDARHAPAIPADVTARVIPANIFAVSAVELVGGDANGPSLKSGDQIVEDTELPTVLFQTTITKLRDALEALGRDREDRTIGILEAMQVATQNKRPKLLTSGAQLQKLLADLDGVMADDPEQSDTTVKALVNATEGLQQTAPELVDALHKAIRPMQVFVEQKGQLSQMLSAGLNTTGTAQTALANNSDKLVQITGNMTPVLGTLAQQAHNFVPAFQKLNTLSNKFFEQVWINELDTPNMRINLALTPTYAYSRADCPRYGELKGNSCFTAPLIPVRPQLPDQLLPQNYQVPPDMAPPAGTVIGPNGNLVAVGAPLIDPNPNLADPNPPLPPGFVPAPPAPLTANPDGLPPNPIGPSAEPAPVAPNAFPPPGPGGPPVTAPASNTAPTDGAEPTAEQQFQSAVAPASFGGNVGPVNSAKERFQLSVMTGEKASEATQLLLGPVVRGTTVTVNASAQEGPK